MTSVATRQSEIFKEPGHALVEDRMVVAARFVAKRRSKPTLADAGWAGERQIVVNIDPFALDQVLEQGAIKPARTAVIDIFDAGLLPQPCDTQSRREALVLPP